MTALFQKAYFLSPLVVTNDAASSKSTVSATPAQPATLSLQPTAGDSVTLSGSQPTATTPSNIKVDGPPAYITWKTPLPNTAHPPLYKIGASALTMEWNIDNEALQVPPTNITVAIISPQKETMIADVVPGSATSATWNLVNITRPLMVGYYTVSLYDQRGPTAIPSPGQLMPDSRLTLGLYNSEAYIPRTDANFCPTCFSHSGSPMDYQVYNVIIGISLFSVILFIGTI